MRLDTCWCTAVAYEQLDDSLTGRHGQRVDHQTIESFVAAYTADAFRTGVDHTSPLLYSGALFEAAEGWISASTFLRRRAR